MEWFGKLSGENGWHRGAFQGTMLAVFVYLAMIENPWVWYAVPIVACIMIGEYNARMKLQKHKIRKETAILNNLRKKCDELEKLAHRWKERYLRLQIKMEKVGLDL